MKQNSSTELLGHSFVKIYSKNGPQTLHPDFFPDFHGFSIGSQDYCLTRGLQVSWSLGSGVPWIAIPTPRAMAML